MATFAERLKEYRQLYDLTQQELADRLGTTKQNVSQYELGRHIPKLDTAKEIADKLNIDMWWLIGLEDKRKDGTKRKLIDAIDNMPEDKIKILISIVENMTELNHSA